MPVCCFWRWSGGRRVERRCAGLSHLLIVGLGALVLQEGMLKVNYAQVRDALSQGHRSSDRSSSSESPAATNVVLITGLPFGHPSEELLMRFLPYVLDMEAAPPVVLRDPAGDTTQARVVFPSMAEAQHALEGLTSPSQLHLAPAAQRLCYGATLAYEEAVRQAQSGSGHAFGSTLTVPLNAKAWLISPPPSPPENWTPTTEGTISATLPFHDLPPPRLLEEVPAEGEGRRQRTFLIYSPAEDGPGAAGDAPGACSSDDDDLMAMLEGDDDDGDDDGGRDDGDMALPTITLWQCDGV